MKRITELTQDYKQTYTLVTEDNKTLILNLEFIQQQREWSFGLVYNNYTLTGQRLILAPNILRRYKNLFPFGLFIQADDGLDPFLLDDFITGRVAVYLLTAAEVEEVEVQFYSPLENG